MNEQKISEEIDAYVIWHPSFSIAYCAVDFKRALGRLFGLVVPSHHDQGPHRDEGDAANQSSPLVWNR